MAGRVALVTAAASGIGLSLARRAARAGMEVVLADVEAAPLAAALEQVRQCGVRALARRVDVSKLDQMQALAADVETEFGPPWLICSNAGVNKFKSAWEYSSAEWDWIIDVNLRGVVNAVQVFVPGLVARNAGHLVNTASASGLYATPWTAPYVATKHAVVGLSECLYREVQGAGLDIGVSVLCPGFVATNMISAERNEPGRRSGGSQPEPLPDLTPLALRMAAAAKSPDEVAGHVFDAVEARRFWVLPHAETMRDIVLAHFRQAIDEQNPDVESTDELAWLVASAFAHRYGAVRGSD